MPAYRRRRNEQGITLVDLIVGLLLLAIGGVGIFSGYRAALAGWKVSQQFAGEQQNARAVLDWVTRRARMAGNNPDNVPYPGIRFQLASATAIVFTGNTDGDSAIECHRIYLNTAEGVVYAHETELPSLCAGGVGRPLSARIEANRLTVTGLAIRYFDREAASGNELMTVPLSGLDRARIRRIAIQITVRGVQFVGPLSMSTQVVVRNN